MPRGPRASSIATISTVIKKDREHGRKEDARKKTRAEGRAQRRGEGRQAALRQDPDRQSRRDRLSRHPYLPAARHQDGGGLLRGRRRRAARPPGRRKGVDRPAAVGPDLPADRQERGGLQEDR